MWFFSPLAGLLRRLVLSVQVAAGQCTQYEQAHLECILAWVAGNASLTLEKHYGLLEDWPQDLVSLKRAQTLAFYVGRQDLMLRLAHKVGPAPSSCWLPL